MVSQTDALFLTVSDTKQDVLGGIGIVLPVSQSLDTHGLNTMETLQRLLSLGLSCRRV